MPRPLKLTKKKALRRIYKFTGPDPSSDIGFWTVVIVSASLKGAKRCLRHHLIAQGRDASLEIANSFKCCRTYTAIVYSDIEDHSPS